MLDTNISLKPCTTKSCIGRYIYVLMVILKLHFANKVVQMFT